MNELANFRDVFRGITPYSGTPPRGFLVDFLGTLTDSRFRVDFNGNPETDGGSPVTTRLPVIEDGEGWFEAVNWVESARAARDRYVMVTLGACYGAQAVGAQRALAALNPMPYRLVAVEPEPDNMKWVRKHFADNGIDPQRQWLLQAAISGSNEPVYFPVGSPGSGAQNCFSTNAREARANYLDYFVKSGTAVQALEAILMQGTTGLIKDLVPGTNFKAEIQAVSSVTLSDVLAPFDVVDYLEADMQQSEIVVFPPHMDILKQRVRRVHIGTHGADVHAELARLLRLDGWSIVFDYAPNSEFETPLGRFSTNDGVLSAINGNLSTASGGRMSIRNVLRTFFGNRGKSVQLQAELRDGIANLADLMNRGLKELIELQTSQSARNEQLLREIVAGVANETNVLNQRLKELIELQVNTTRK